MKAFFVKLAEKLDFTNNKVKYIIGAVILVLQIVASVVTVSYFNRLNVLPAKYFYLLVGILALCLIFTLMLNLIKKIHMLGKVFGVLVCGLLVCICFYAHHTIRLLDTITEEHYDVDNYVVVVPSSSSITDVKAMAGKTVGALDNMNNRELAEEAFSKLKESAGSKDITYKSYDSTSAMINDMNSGVVDALLYNQTLNDMLDEVIPGYIDSVRIIAEFEVRVRVSDTQEYPTEAETETSASDAETETESERPTEADNIKVPVYDPSKDPNAQGGGGYIGGDNTVDNSKKGPITDRTFNIYISGNDNYGAVSGRSRSDVNIIMTVNPKTKEIVLTNTPRDYYVPIPGVTPGNWRDKLTHAGNYGVWTSVATLENIYEIQIDYYVRLNFTSFMKVIDTLGGVEVESPADFTTVNGMHFNKGKITLKTGFQALVFARERYAFSAGDHQRGRNQMAIIEGIINKALSPAILTKYGELVNSVATSVQTNMTMDEITQLAKMQIGDGASWTITQQAVTGTGGSRECYSMKGYMLSTILPNQSSIDSCKAKINSVLAK